MKHMALKKNLDVTIHEAFLEEILQGNWKPGQALNLDELAERYGVSRTPIQQALKRMHTQGMVVFSSKGHFSVPTFSEKEVCDIIEMRLLLEHQALTDIQNKLLPMDFETLERLCSLQQDVQHRPDPAHRSGFPPDTGGTGREPLSQ